MITKHEAKEGDQCKLAHVNITRWTSIWPVWLEGSLSSGVYTCSEWQSRAVYGSGLCSVKRCELVWTQQRLIVYGQEIWCSLSPCNLLGHWILIFIFLKIFEAFGEKIISLVAVYFLVVCIRMPADTCRNTRWKNLEWNLTASESQIKCSVSQYIHIFYHIKGLFQYITTWVIFLQIWPSF